MIRRYIACVATLSMDALIWAMSLRPAPPHPSGWYEQQRIAQDKDMEARRIREQEEARTQWVRDHQREGGS